MQSVYGVETCGSVMSRAGCRDRHGRAKKRAQVFCACPIAASKHSFEDRLPGQGRGRELAVTVSALQALTG